MRKISKPSEGIGRNRLLSIEEKNRFLIACQSSSNPHLYPIVSIALLTGMRFGEIVNLRWEDIDYKNKTITLEETKKGKKRILPLTSAVEKILSLSDQIDIATKLVFKPNSPSTGLVFKFSSPTNRSGLVDIRNAFVKALKLAEISNFRFHDLRHAAASYLAISGASQGELMAILGYNTPTMTRRYTYNSQKHVATVLEKMHNNLLMEDVDGKPADK